jgi:hypothetical protein
MAQTDTRGTPRKLVLMKSPFLCLPAEIRRMIYRYVLIAPSGTIYSNPLYSRTLSLDWDLSKDIALLRTCRQVHEEASAILYGENHVHDFCFEPELRGGCESHRPFHFPLNLVQSLEITFYVSYYASMSIEGICTFLKKSLVARQCSFKRMILRYKHTSSNERDLLDLKSGRGFELLKLIFAVQVLRELEIIFGCWEPKACLKPKAYLAALWSEPIQRLAVRKSWTATESYETSIPLCNFEDPEVEMRYLVRPETAIFRRNNDQPF